MSAVGALLRRHRDAAGLTQEELAERAGLSARTVSDIERGLRSRLYADTAARLADALGLADAALTAFLDVARGRSAPPERRTHLPRPITPLVGRETELATIAAALAAGRRLVTITGLGGVGKTRLALAAAERVDEAFAARLHYLAVPVGASAERFDGLVAGAIGAADEPAALGGHLRGRPTLLVLDSFEHAISASTALQELLVATPELHAIVTSRQPLQIAGEVHVPLAPLELPAPGDPDWHSAAAVRLFLDRARDVAADLHPDAEAVVEICRRLSGLPLALELAAAQLRYLPLALLRDRLRDGFTELLIRQPGAVDVTNPVDETLSWTIESLPPGTALALRACALLPGGWRLDALEGVCPGGTALSATAALVDKGLAYLERSDDDPDLVARWQMLDVVRGFTLAHTPADSDGAWQQAYQSFYGDLLAAARTKLGREREWFRVIHREEANLRVALGWAADAGDAQTLLRLANGMWFYWQARGALVEGRHWLGLGLALEPAADAATRMTALWGDAMLAHHQGDDEAAEARAAQLHALATEQADTAALRHAHTIRGMVAIGRDDAMAAVAEFRRALNLAARINDEWIKATSQLNLGLGLLSAGRVDEARGALGAALQGYEQLEDERFHARCVGYLGMAALLDGDPERARSLFLDSLRVFHRLGEPGGTAEALTGLAAADAAAGHADRAALLAAAGDRLRHGVAARQLPLDQRTNERYLALAREQLGEERWAELSRAGYGSSLDEAVEVAFATASSVRP